MIPCKDCITFAICKTQVSQSVIYHSSLYGAIVNILLEKCSIVKEYVKVGSYSTLNYSPAKIESIANYYKEVL